jgi:hypothetical protein
MSVFGDVVDRSWMLEFRSKELLDKEVLDIYA